ncbi:MAG: hypothetical protein ACRDQ4_13490 [Pseudonocardiaceae bacterium]
MTALLWRRRAVVAGATIAFVLAAACSGPRSGASVTGDVSGCAAVLPLATDIVHDEGTLILVRRISKGGADALSRKLGATPPAPPRSHAASSGPHRPVRSRWPQSCLVVYHGSYPPGTIAGASPPAVAGHYTLMVLRVRHPSVDRILVTDRLPRL